MMSSSEYIAFDVASGATFVDQYKIESISVLLSTDYNVQSSV